jgi:hypothetical protein
MVEPSFTIKMGFIVMLPFDRPYCTRSREEISSRRIRNSYEVRTGTGCFSEPPIARSLISKPAVRVTILSSDARADRGIRTALDEEFPPEHFASIGLAWSSDLKSWAWPDQK